MHWIRLPLSIVLISFALPALAEEATPAETHRLVDYEGFSPFFGRESYQDGRTRTNACFWLYRNDRAPDGDGYFHLLPFVVDQREEQGADHSLAILPPLYIHGRSPLEGSEAGQGHDVLFNFAHWWSGDSSHTVLWPLLQTAREPEERPYRWIPTLYRHGSWEGGDRTACTLGAPHVLSLLEYSLDRTSSAWAFGNFFNFSSEADSGLPLGKLSHSENGDYEAHLFPLFFAGNDGGSRYVHTALLGHWSGAGDDGSSGWVSPLLLSWYRSAKDRHDLELLWPLFAHEAKPRESSERFFPFYFHGEERDGDGKPASGYRFLIPLYGSTSNEASGEADHYFPLALGHYGTRKDGMSLDLLWPLEHYSRRGEDFSLRLLPFLDRKKDGSESCFGVGGILYREYQSSSLQIVSRWFPFPLGHLKTSPEGTIAWAVPAFYHAREKSPRLESEETWVAPTFFTSAEKQTDEESEIVRTSESVSLWPLFGHSELHRAKPEVFERREDSTLFPLFQLERTSRGEPGKEAKEAKEVNGMRLEAPWPLVHLEREKGSFDFHLFPALWLGESEARSYQYLFPLLSVERGSSASRNLAHSISPIKWFSTPSEKSFRLDPFLFSWKKDANEESLTGPLAWFRYRSSPGSWWFHLLPIGFGEGEGKRSGLGIFPFYYGRDQGDGPIQDPSPARFFFAWNRARSEQETRHSLFWKAMEYRTTQGGDSSFRLLDRLFIQRREEGQRELAVGPFFRTFSDEQAKVRKFSLLTFLYRSEERDGVRTRRIFFIPVSHSPVKAG